jgi:dihydroorotate dehydrogenase electron transfer subunit
MTSTQPGEEMIQEKVQVLWNTQVAPSYFRIGLKCDPSYLKAAPGQFVMLGFADRVAPLLRRPFSIHRLVSKNGALEAIELLYKVVGQATAVLSGRKAGDVLDILGPLGNGFSISDQFRRIYLAAGGIGVAPMVFLAEHLRRREADLAGCRVFLGGRSQADLLCREDFLRLGIEVDLTTDDGSAGEMCLVTHPLELASRASRPDIIYACGPEAMLRCVVGIAEKYDVRCEISVETAMACGMGACLGCVVEAACSSDRYLHACIDGPVFDSRRIKL